MAMGRALQALDPHVGETLQEFLQVLEKAGLDRELLALCAARAQQMIGAGTLAAPPQNNRERVALAFAEQYVLDAHGVTDDLCRELNTHFSPPELAALTTGIATFEALARTRVMLQGVAE